MEQVMMHMEMKAKQVKNLIKNLKTELETLRVQYIEMTKEWAINDFNRLLKMKRKVSELDHLREYASEVYYKSREKSLFYYNDSIIASGKIIKMNGREYDMSRGIHRGDYDAFMIDGALALGIIGVLKFWESRGVDGMELVSYDSALEIDNDFIAGRLHIKELNMSIEKYRDESNGYRGRTNKHIHMNGSLKRMQERGLDIVNEIHIEWFVDNAKKHFASSIEKLAYRLLEKGLNLDNLSFDTSHVDANISTTINDGDKSVRAWTIIASGEVQRPHYRYLIK